MTRRPPRPVQQSLRFRQRWGGKRKSAGRPRKRGSGVSHDARPRIAARWPVHINIKLVRDVGNLRTKKKVKVIRGALAAAVARGFRIIDWSIQSNHLHLIVETTSAGALSRSMQGLCIRIARGINRQLSRKGTVFADRYHARALKTPREVRNARAYVLLNARRHAAQRGALPQRRGVDPCSSWAWFDGWKDCPRAWVAAARAGPDAEPCCVAPRSWLMAVGWRRCGLIRIDEVPGR